MLRTLYRGMPVFTGRCFPRALGRTALPHTQRSLVETSWFGFGGLEILEPRTQSKHPPPPLPFSETLAPKCTQNQGCKVSGQRDLTQANILQLVLAAGCPDGSIPVESRRACGLCPGNITFRKEKTGLLSATLQIPGIFGHEEWLDLVKQESIPSIAKLGLAWASCTQASISGKAGTLISGLRDKTVVELTP